MLIIRPNHVAAYFQCPRKAYLLLFSDQKPAPTDFELLQVKAKETTTEAYYRKAETTLCKGSDLKKGILSVWGTCIKTENFEFDCQLLLKRKGRSLLGNHYYEPGIFLGTKKISKEDRMQLAFLGLLLKKIQGKFPYKALFINKVGEQKRVKLDRLKDEVNAALNDIQEFNVREPKLMLNKHCPQCSFLNLCKAQAIKEDNLTLLDRISTKQINKLEKKGIFTLKQLSYIYKPRRKSKHAKNSVVTFKPELQALAIRTGKTFIQVLPTLERKPIEIFLDIEGLPDDSFFYLFGVLIVGNDRQVYYSFWADTPEDEETSWIKLTDLLYGYPEAFIYHYGSFEAKVFEGLAKRYSTNIDSLRKRLVNVNKYIFGKIYFPTYSNGLKQLGIALGMKWTDEKASGLQSIVWRNYWEEGKEDYKKRIIRYNQEDCVAVMGLVEELSRIQVTADVSNDIEFIQNPKKIASTTSQEVHDQFNLVFNMAHHNYDRKKIKVDLLKKEVKKIKQKDKEKKGFVWLGKRMQKPNKTVIVPADKYCFKHPERRLTKSKITTKRVLIDLVFGKNGVRKVITENVGIHGNCPICNFSHPPLYIRQLSRQLYGHNYKAWYVFQRIELQLPFTKINNGILGIINDKVGSAYGCQFIQDFSDAYEETEHKIIKNILNSPFIHVDETTVSIRGENQYVWVFTTDKYITFKFSKTRDAIIAKNFLRGYQGVLISDFFTGYDAIECAQQKCWVHFIRDLNNNLWSNPFDKEYESFVCEIRNLIIPIIQACHQYGLKKHFLAKHQKSVYNFYKDRVEAKAYKSELCILYQKRLKRYKDSLFTFIKQDGISWHNNAAENGIRHICVQRKISGSFGEVQFPHYLRMVSIMQTCKLQGKSFFKFLLSKEKDVSAFGSKKTTKIITL
jgi:predicted RecB family nuclease